MKTFLLIYWIATTIIGVIWIAKHPSSRRGDDEEYVTLLEIIAMVFPAAIVSWVMVPMMLLNEIKFRRRPPSYETTGEMAERHLFIAVLVFAFILAAVMTFTLLYYKQY